MREENGDSYEKLKKQTVFYRYGHYLEGDGGAEKVPG